VRGVGAGSVSGVGRRNKNKCKVSVKGKGSGKRKARAADEDVEMKPDLPVPHPKDPPAPPLQPRNTRKSPIINTLPPTMVKKSALAKSSEFKVDDPEAEGGRGRRGGLCAGVVEVRWRRGVYARFLVSWNQELSFNTTLHAHAFHTSHCVAF
jgi:hypothetical protein